ncbi:mycothiol synthase [Kutzneria viridogrisea]|uniref:Mycothiol acetyltransferase n=1 Tax=Kutzneria viridogrisea TaxID=47990 RepID=A0ABR6BS17_9PSEU|nr:mycothiol synthase [Kutzneria viridogrisea]
MVDMRWQDERLTALDVDEVFGVFEAARLADGREGAGGLPSFLTGPGPHLVATESGRTVGYLHLDTAGDSFGNQVAELVVHPAARQRGLGSAMVRALLDRVGDAKLRVWAHGDHPGAAALAASHGFERVRELLRMRWEVGQLPEPVWRPGVTVRTFVPGADEAAVIEVNRRAFSWHPEQGALTVADLERTEAEPWFDPAGFFLAVDAEDRVLGFHWTKVHREREPLGEVYVVGVDPDAQGGGLGKALTLVGLHHLREAGLRRVMLYVESDNTPAVAVYTKLGFGLWDADVQYAR